MSMMLNMRELIRGINIFLYLMKINELRQNNTVRVIICILYQEENLPKILPAIKDSVDELIFVVRCFLRDFNHRHSTVPGV